MGRKVTRVAFNVPEIPKKKNVAAYCRVSSGKDAMLHSLAAQVSYYSELIQSHGEWEYAGVYADEAKTGTKDTRENFVRLLSDCRAGKIDLILTKSISRFARNTVTLLETVRELKLMGVDVYFEEQNIHSMRRAGRQARTRNGASRRILRKGSHGAVRFLVTATWTGALRSCRKKHKPCG